MDNSYYSTDLFYRETTDLVFTKMIETPADAVACLDFKYQKYSLGE